MTDIKTSIFDEAAFGHEAAKALASAYSEKYEYYKYGWKNALIAVKEFGIDAVNQSCCHPDTIHAEHKKP